MQTVEQQNPQYHGDLEEEEEEDYSESGGSDAEYDPAMDPSYSFLEKSTRGKLAKLTINKKSKFRIGKNLDMDADVEIDPEEAEMNVEKIDEKGFEQVQEIINAGKLEKLKLEQCKVYLRKNRLRLTGKKDTLVQRIKEHQEILNGGGEKKYPASSFVLDCKGDACMGDVVMFEQNVYELYNIASRSAIGPPCGTRIVAGRIVKESYGAAKQQHTFTIEVLWSKGEKPLRPLHPLLIKGRNLYRLKTLRQRWENEEERRKILIEKHSRGSLARSARETRIEEKEKKKVLRENRALKKEERNGSQSQLSSTLKANHKLQAQQPGSSINLEKAAPEPQLLGISVDSGKMTIQSHGKMDDGAKKLIQPQHSGSTIIAVERGNGFQQLAVRPQHRISFVNGENMENRHRQPAVQPVNWHRQPLTSINHYRAMYPVNRHGCRRQQLCKFYAQGRCYYGDDCKFLHDPR